MVHQSTKVNNLTPISYQNDFLFCPYSIYLHQMNRETEEETVKAIPQKKQTNKRLFFFAKIKDLRYFCP